jgi:hypothetical protein
MNYIITKNKSFFSSIGTYNFCNLEDMVLPDIIAYDSETTGLKPILNDIFAIDIETKNSFEIFLKFLINYYNNLK